MCLNTECMRPSAAHPRGHRRACPFGRYPGTPGTYELIYRATNSAGKNAVVNRQVTVIAPDAFITTWKTK